MSLDSNLRNRPPSLRIALLSAIAAAGINSPTQKLAAEEHPYRPYFVNEEAAPALDPVSSAKRELLLKKVAHENQTTIALKALLRSEEAINHCTRLWDRISQIENSSEMNARFNLFRSLLMYLDDSDNVSTDPNERATERENRLFAFFRFFENDTSFKFLMNFIRDVKIYQTKVSELEEDPNILHSSYTISSGGQRSAEEIFSNMMPRLYDPAVLTPDFFKDPQKIDLLRYAAFGDLSIFSSDIQKLEPRDQIESFLRLARAYESQGWISYRLFAESITAGTIPEHNFTAFEKTLNALQGKFAHTRPLSDIVISELLVQFHPGLHLMPEFQAFLLAPENQNTLRGRVEQAIHFAQRHSRLQKFSREYLESLEDIATSNIREDFERWINKRK